MFQQFLCDSSGYAVLSKNGSKGLTQIMKSEVSQAKLITYLFPSVLAETVIESYDKFSLFHKPLSLHDL